MQSGYPENDEEKEEKVDDSVPVITKAPDTPLTPEVKKRNYLVVLHHVKGVSEQLRRIFKSYDIHAYFKPSNTLWQLLVHPKDKVEKGKVVVPVYHIYSEDCDASYIGETE